MDFLLGALTGAYIGIAIIILILGGADPEGRFKLRFALLWPFYLKSIFFRRIRRISAKGSLSCICFINF